ncbi:MAG: CoA ester lyase [Lautropia sp.]
MALHPRDVLHDVAGGHVVMPVCDHYCGSRPLIEKSLALQDRLGPVFDVTGDCEDGAAVGAEPEHAAMIAAAIASPANRFDQFGARPHDPQHPAFENDLQTLIGGAGRRIAYLTIPKVESAADLDAADLLCRNIEARHGISRRIPFQVLIESPRALRDVGAIAAHPRVEAVAFGLMDYVSSFGGAIGAEAMHSPGQFEHPLVARALVEIALACHAHGKVATHGVTLAIGDGAAAGADARRAAAEFGFLRKWSIHPKQIEPIVAAFRPDTARIGEAAEILIAAQQADWGPIRYRDQLHDRASYRYWWLVLERARLTGAGMPAAAAAFFKTDDTGASR